MMSDEEMEQERLPVELTDAEVWARGELIAKLVGDREELEESRKAVSDETKGRLKVIDAQIVLISREARERREYRLVDVRRVRVENTKEIQWIRADTGEVLRSRPMTETEKQIKLFPAPNEQMEQVER